MCVYIASYDKCQIPITVESAWLPLTAWCLVGAVSFVTTMMMWVDRRSDTRAWHDLPVYIITMVADGLVAVSNIVSETRYGTALQNE